MDIRKRLKEFIDKDHYDISNIYNTEAQYNILYGERSNGKSYMVKIVTLLDAFENGIEFGYIRRWREEITVDKIIEYFADAPIEKITNGTYVSLTAYRSNIYFIDADKNKSPERIGKSFCLTGETHYKSLAYPKMDNIIFEEFITDKGYLRDEVHTLENLVSTIMRRRKGRVWLIGNTLTRLVPYFNEWELTQTPKQKQGQIVMYRHETDERDEQTGETIIINIAVEYTAHIKSNSKMFFSKKSKMITKGAWESKEQPHLPDKLMYYKKYYRVLYEYRSYRYAMLLIKHKTEKNVLVYIYPYTKNELEDFNRIISDKWYNDKRYTPSLTNVYKYDRIIKRMFDLGKVVYSDNLTGTEFLQIKKEKGGL